MRNKFLLALKNSIYDLVKNPIIIIPSLALFALLTLLSKLSISLNYKLQTTPLLISWLVIFILISISFLSLIFSGIIGMSKEIIEKKSQKYTLMKFLPYSKKFFLKSFLVLAMFIFLYIFIIGVMYGFTKVMIILKPYFTLTPSVFSLISFLIYFTWLAGVVIFFTFTNFYMIIYNLSIRESIKSSFKFVIKNYSGVLSISVLFFMIFFLLSKYSSLWSSAIEFLIVTPYLSLVLSRLIMNAKS